MTSSRWSSSAAITVAAVSESRSTTAYIVYTSYGKQSTGTYGLLPLLRSSGLLACILKVATCEGWCYELCMTLRIIFVVHRTDEQRR